MEDLSNRLRALENSIPEIRTAVDGRFGAVENRATMLETSFQTMAEGVRAKSSELEGVILANKSAADKEIQELKTRLEELFGEGNQ